MNAGLPADITYEQARRQRGAGGGAPPVGDLAPPVKLEP